MPRPSGGGYPEWLRYLIALAVLGMWLAFGVAILLDRIEVTPFVLGIQGTFLPVLYVVLGIPGRNGNGNGSKRRSTDDEQSS